VKAKSDMLQSILTESCTSKSQPQWRLSQICYNQFWQNMYK